MNLKTSKELNRIKKNGKLQEQDKEKKLKWRTFNSFRK